MYDGNSDASPSQVVLLSFSETITDPREGQVGGVGVSWDKFFSGKETGLVKEADVGKATGVVRETGAVKDSGQVRPRNSFCL